MSSRSRSASLVHRSRKSLLPLRLQARMVDEMASVRIAHSFVCCSDLPFVQLDELSHRFGGESGATAICRFRKIVESFSEVGIQPQRYRISHCEPFVYKEY